MICKHCHKERKDAKLREHKGLLPNMILCDACYSRIKYIHGVK